MPERFKKTSGGFGSLQNTEMATAQALSQTKKGFKKGANPNKTSGGNEATTFGEQPPIGDVKQVNVKTANKTIRTMRADKRGTAGFQDEDSDEMALENVLIDVIG